MSDTSTTRYLLQQLIIHFRNTSQSNKKSPHGCPCISLTSMWTVSLVFHIGQCHFSKLVFHSLLNLIQPAIQHPVNIMSYRAVWIRLFMKMLEICIVTPLAPKEYIPSVFPSSSSPSSHKCSRLSFLSNLSCIHSIL
mgnify:FL=1